jgi:hypothetical protein
MSRLATKQADLLALQPTAESAALPTDAGSPRIRLPSDLSVSLEYLDNDELERLREAISSEINRRSFSLPRTKPAAAPSDRSVDRHKKGQEPGEIPAGKVSLIQASFRAGLKPAR